MKVSRVTVALLFALWAAPLIRIVHGVEGSEPITVGSKSFTESVILGEMLAHLARQAGIEVSHQRQLGGTRVLWNALLSGEIDAYPEYTGTLTQETLANEHLLTEAQLRQALASRGLRMSRPLGFDNSYAIGVQEALAGQLKLRTISDLRDHPELVLAQSAELLHP